MSDIARARPRIEAVGTRIVLGHMGSAQDFAVFAGRYSLSDLLSVADPQLTLYQALGLKRGRLMQMIGPKVPWAWLKATMAGHLMGRTKGDPFQLPGAFLLHHGQVVKGRPYRNVSDRPDYVVLATPERANGV